MTKTAKLALLLPAVLILTCCGNGGRSDDSKWTDGLADSLQSVASRYPGEIGVAVITDAGDTVAVNNENKYPLMSVFKLHQAISLCNGFADTAAALDSVVSIQRVDLNPDTWSPMLKEHSGDVITLTVGDLLRYTLMQSDNNASNYMFANMQPVAVVDSFIATLIPRESFRLAVTEADMWNDHSLCYRNSSSPLGAAILINRVFTDSIVPAAGRDFICAALRECRTGTDRIVAPLRGIEGVRTGHKTGSGFRGADGVLSAHNDVGFIVLPDGRSYTLAVLVKDFHGTEQEAARVIAEISALTYRAITDDRR